jgi:hypothetical protein
VEAEARRSHGPARIQPERLQVLIDKLPLTLIMV